MQNAQRARPIGPAIAPKRQWRPGRGLEPGAAASLPILSRQWNNLNELRLADRCDLIAIKLAELRREASGRDGRSAAAPASAATTALNLGCRHFDDRTGADTGGSSASSPASRACAGC